MAKSSNYKTGRAHVTGDDDKDDLLRAMGLVGLPLLAFQRNMLKILRNGLDEAGIHKPVQTLAQNELHALFMILDPTARWRNSLGADIEKKLKDTLDAAVPKVISGAVSLIDAQATVLDSFIKELDPARKRAKH